MSRHSDITRSEGEPHDRLTRICDAMTRAMDAHPEKEPEDKAVVFLTGTTKGGIQMHGWKDDTEAIAAVLLSLQAVFRSNGKELTIIAVPNDVSGLAEEK